MASIARHIQIARDSGAKAGFNFYMAQNVPTARETQALIRESGNRKAQFEAYCSYFSDLLDAPTRNAPARSEHDDDQRQSIAERILAKLGIDLSEIVEDTPGANIQVVSDDKPAPRRRTTRTTSAKPAPKAENAPLSVGDTFLYHGTNLVSEWEVLRVNKTHSVATNGKRESNWKHATVAKLVKSGKIDLI